MKIINNAVNSVTVLNMYFYLMFQYQSYLIMNISITKMQLLVDKHNNLML
jgi:hypothetical protein